MRDQFVMLSNLAEIRTAAKILLGAHYRVKEINPLDYCYSAMHIRLSQLPKCFSLLFTPHSSSLSLSLSLVLAWR
jgi:hypothetical protein